MDQDQDQDPKDAPSRPAMASPTTINSRSWPGEEGEISAFLLITPRSYSDFDFKYSKSNLTSSLNSTTT